MNKYFFGIFGISLLSAFPENPSVMSKTAEISMGEALKICADDRAIIHWSDFSIEKNEKVIFLQPHREAAILNRVVGPMPSRILGKIEANGKVILINQSGILIGESGRIDTGSFYALSLEVHDRAFKEKGELNCREISWGMVVNAGEISGDKVCLAGFEVQNMGSIDSQMAMLIGAKELFMQDGPIAIRTKCSSEESLRLREQISSQGNPYAAAFKLPEDLERPQVTGLEGIEMMNMPGPAVLGKGAIRAREVYVFGDYINLRRGSIIDVSGVGNGGEIVIGGAPGSSWKNSRIVSIDGTLDADGLGGQGGRIVAYSQGAMCFRGNATARGFIEGGEVNVFGNEFLLFQGETDLSSELGLAGRFSLDSPLPVEVCGR